MFTHAQDGVCEGKCNVDERALALESEKRGCKLASRYLATLSSWEVCLASVAFLYKIGDNTSVSEEI